MRSKYEKVSNIDGDWQVLTFHPKSKRMIQQDGYNCGIFVCLWIRGLCKRPVFDGTLDFDSNDGDYVRFRIVHMFQVFSSIKRGRTRKLDKSVTRKERGERKF